MKYIPEIEIAEPMPDQPSTIERDEHTRSHYRNDRVSFTRKELDHVTEKRELAPNKALKSIKSKTARELRC
ncbi:hypothetical protein [Undibacterium sp.]|uniref:hypothetical protein n=1 Tax=Undibacterium sp. TaxID=1914977 RepID=UPI00374CDA32